MRSTRNVAAKAAAAAGAVSAKGDCTPTIDKQVKTQVITVKSKQLGNISGSKKMKAGARRSQRIRNSVKPAGNHDNEQQVYDLEDTSSETRDESVVREMSVELVECRKHNGGTGQMVKRNETMVNKPSLMNGGVDDVGPEEEEQVNNVDKTQQVVDNCNGHYDGIPARSDGNQFVNNADANQEVHVEMSSSQKISDKINRYKSLYSKAMRRLEAMTEERNLLSRQLAVAETKIGVLNDFKDHLSEVTKRLDRANERLEAYEKTTNPLLVDMLRDFLTTTTQSQTVEVPLKIGSVKDAGLDNATKPHTRSAKKRKVT